jgi:hypothetical protein
MILVKVIGILTLATCISVWHECGRSSMDRANRPKDKRWFP